MLQTVNKNQIESELQQKQFIMMGGSLKVVQNKLSQIEIEKMKKNYVGMYYALAAINWGQGITLGMAWQKALEQMDAFVASKTKIPNHPANAELKKYHNEFRRDMAKTIMTSEYTGEKLPEHLKKYFIDYGTKRVKETKGALDELYKTHMPKQELSKVPVVKSFEIAKRKTQQLLLMQQIINQRVA